MVSDHCRLGFGNRRKAIAQCHRDALVQYLSAAF